MFVHMNSAIHGQDRDWYAIFCTFQTINHHGPAEVESNPYACCRPETSIHTQAPVGINLSGNESIESLYCAGARGVERDFSKGNNASFLDLCQLAVLELPPNGAVPARLWKEELSIDVLKLFEKEFNHIITKHRDVYEQICGIVALKAGESLQHRALRLKDTLDHQIKRDPGRQVLRIPSTQRECGEADCTFNSRVRKLVVERKNWAPSKAKFFEQPEPFPKEEKTGKMTPFKPEDFTKRKVILKAKRTPISAGSTRWSDIRKPPKPLPDTKGTATGKRKVKGRRVRNRARPLKGKR